ncbi:hypothetical protein SAMN02787142_2521 [Burkholderia sp. WP9]|uniref:hypothetical protein n=1 Tax=Burkholderia sp. WP9 TaxID=1500263 RepID=UPI0008960ACC|nr:hypothetical protein [Burkholderia sp. WP9]SED08580.1 hypothetical protein SAMN02787142_2521 [Burkholderia sp. WP9]
MLLNNKQVINTAVAPRIAMRRKFLTSLVAGGGALVLAACGGGGSDSSNPDAVANRWRKSSGGASSTSPTSSASAPAAASSSTAATGTLQSTVGEAAAQMLMAHEANPNGVPLSYDWAAAPVIWQPTPPSDFTAMTSWGEIQFAAGPGTTATADTAQLRNFKTYVLNSSGQLTLVQNEGSIGGALNLPTFAGNTDFPSQISNSSGVTTLGLDPTKAFQFVPPNRVPIPAGTQGVVVTVEARISSPAGATDPNINTSFILSLGADWWQSMTAQWPNNTGVGQGRFVFLTTEWQTFTFTSIQKPSAALAATVI